VSLAKLTAKLLLVLCTTAQAVFEALYDISTGKRDVFAGSGAAAAASKKACLHRSSKRPLSNCGFCRAAEPNVFQNCRKIILRHQRQQTALKKPDKTRATTQCMVMGTVSATDITAQPLRLDYITTKPL